MSTRKESLRAFPEEILREFLEESLRKFIEGSLGEFKNETLREFLGISEEVPRKIPETISGERKIFFEEIKGVS